MRNGIWGQEPRSILARGYQIVEFGTRPQIPHALSMFKQNMENQESFNHILVSISTESCAKDETQNDSPTAANILKNYIAANSDIDNFTIYKDNLYVLINSNYKNEINDENTIIKMRTKKQDSL